MSQQNKVENAWHGINTFQVDGLAQVNNGNDAGFQTRKITHEYINSLQKLGSALDQPQSGSNQPEGGVKHDNGKPDLSHISLLLVEEVARVREFGAKKYSRGNWLKGFKYTRSIAAALRHIFAFSSGEDLDPESGLSHIAHAVCCLEHLMNDFKNHKYNDDRK